MTSKRLARLAAVGAAAFATLLVWVIVEPIGGLDLRQPAMDNQPTADLGPVQVVLATIVAALAGWALLAVLERFTKRAGTIWTVVAVVFAVLSIASPLAGGGVSTGNRLALVAMHVIAAAVFIPLVRRTVSSPETAGEYAAAR